MKVLKERTEIATAINFHKYPVIVIDLANKDEYGFTGTKVNIDCCEDYYIHAVIRTYNDTNRLQFSAYGYGLVDKLTYEDCMEMVEYNQAPIVKPDQDILVCLHNSRTKSFYLPVLLRTGKGVSRHCMTPMGIEEFTVEAT